MTLTKESMKFISDQASLPLGRTTEVNGKKIVFGEDSTPKVIERYQYEMHKTATLESVVEFVEYSKKHVSVIFTTHNAVLVLGDLNEKDLTYDKLLHAKFESNRFKTDQYLEQEDFIIELLTNYEKDGTVADILKVVGNMTDEKVKTKTDDGISQKVNVKTGVASSSDVEVVNPITLRPRRTFAEIEQPKALYVLRFDEGGRIGLFETNDVSWKIEAIASIKEYLRNKLPDVQVIG